MPSPWMQAGGLRHRRNLLLRLSHHPGAFDTSFNGDTYDAFVVKLNAAGSALDYATFLGGSLGDGGSGIAVDGSGAAYLTGGTFSSDFPTTGRLRHQLQRWHL